MGVVKFMTLVIFASSAFAGAPVSAAPAESPGLTTDALVAIREGVAARAEAILGAQRGQPLVRAEKKPPLGTGRAAFVRAYSFSLVEFAARSLWWHESIEAANAALRENAEYYLANHPELYDKDNFHWHSEAVLRLVEFYGAGGSRRAGLIRPETEERILEAIWLYCRRQDKGAAKHSNLAEADDLESATWWVKESENHHVQSFTTLWHFARIARHREAFQNRRYDDGRTVQDHYASWNRYVKRYLLERARKGMFIEMMSPAYNATLLKGIFNVYDFADDPELKRRSRLFLDLYFAYWGQEQIDGVAGGGKARIYSDTKPRSLDLGYVFFGLGQVPEFESELFTALTTSYRPALVVVDLACDRRGRGVYEVQQRPLGLALSSEYFQPPTYRLRTDYGGNLRYTYCTPEFVVGTTMSEARPEPHWTMISSQNRRQGVIFAGEPVAVISPQVEATQNRRAYNTQWSVQRKGTLVTQKLKTSRGAGAARVWFSGQGLTEPEALDGWIFTESAGAYAAVRVVEGGGSWVAAEEAGTGRWLQCQYEFSPVILEVARKSDYPSAQHFRAAVRHRPIMIETDRRLRFRSIYGDDFTFFTDYSAPPRINDVPVDYAPDNAFASPFLESVWDSGVIHLRKGNRHEILDFNAPNAQ